MKVGKKGVINIKKILKRLHKMLKNQFRRAKINKDTFMSRDRDKRKNLNKIREEEKNH